MEKGKKSRIISYGKRCKSFWILGISDDRSPYFCSPFLLRLLFYAVVCLEGPSGYELLFSLPYALTETLILLSSSFTCALAMFEIHRKQKSFATFFFMLTILLGLFFSFSRGRGVLPFYPRGGYLAAGSAFLFLFFYLSGYSWVTYFYRIVMDGCYYISHLDTSTCSFKCF